MNDLVNMLRQSNIGIDITSQLINCLLFADDVVLMANSQDELQKSLQISHNCACKWNLRFNSKKSKVMVIGKNLNKNSNWVLGNEKIDEVNEYKYLGHFINRSMKSNYHINTYLKSKSENQMNYLIRILGEHGDFNRVNFGEALWKNVIRPSLTHACAVWMPLSSSSKKNSRKLAISCRENNITYQNEYP